MGKKGIKLVRKDFFTRLKFWQDLDAAEKQAVESHTRALAVSMAGACEMRLDIGKHLLALRAVLDGQRLFHGYLKTLKFGWRTAYRYMQCYETVSGQLPEFALRAAAARRIDLVGYQPKRPFGPYTEAIKRLPPPTIEGKVHKWLDDVQEFSKAHASRRGGRFGEAAPDPQERMKLPYRAVVAQHRAVKEQLGGAAANRWAVKLIGFLLTEFGLEPDGLAAVPVPAGFQAVRGRPRLIKTVRG